MKKRILIALILALTFSLFSQGDGVVIDKVVAIVGKNMIMMSDVENEIVQAKAKGVYSSNLRCQIFEQLVFQKLLLDQAQKDSIEITDAEIEGNLDQRIRFFVSQIGSEEKLEEFYGKSVSQIKEEFRGVIAKQMLAERMRSELTKDIKATPTEIRRFYNKMPKDSLPQIDRQLSLQQIVIHPPVEAKEKLAIKEKLRAYRDRILKGEKFSTLAVLYSEDIGSATKGGELGFKGRSDLVPAFAAVAFKLKEPGDISRIVESEFGFHIIQLIEKRGELMNLRHILLKPKISAQDLYKAQAKIDSVRNLIVAEKITFEEAVNQFSKDENTNKNNGIMLNMYSGDTYFKKEHLQPSLSYVLRNIKQGDFTKTFKTQDEKGRDVYKIVKVKEIIEPHAANLQLDYKLLQDMTLKSKQQRFVDQWIKQKIENTYIRIEDEYKDCSLLKDNE